MVVKISVEYDPNLRLIQCTFVGPVPANDITRAQIEAIKLAGQKNTNLFLIDNSKWKTSLSLFDIYKWPQLYKEMQVNRQYRLAMIQSSDFAAKKAIQFYEVVCRNRGWDVAVFQHRQEAIAWLKNPSATII
jgi:hypothetical protein